MDPEILSLDAVRSRAVAARDGAGPMPPDHVRHPPAFRPPHHPPFQPSQLAQKVTAGGSRSNTSSSSRLTPALPQAISIAAAARVDSKDTEESPLVPCAQRTPFSRAEAIHPPSAHPSIASIHRSRSDMQ
ncbi:hypothetical protein EW146_g9276 [Bondarzewia mesenterica]|uniref:Uncharacterized protein n=1 Tax=Bondarzewia mesenterica TaxID=1095465 RepID=A0A4S4L9K7_9AGAM|nr:hypothetical protein EW146_g9276 [Bondarzewia mesenterica]